MAAARERCSITVGRLPLSYSRFTFTQQPFRPPTPVGVSSQPLSTQLAAAAEKLGPAPKPSTNPTTKPPTNRSTNPPPTKPPTQPPTKPRTQPPTKPPTQPPTKLPTQPPTKLPTQPPTKPPTQPPTKPPTNAPSKAPTNQTGAAVFKKPFQVSVCKSRLSLPSNPRPTSQPVAQPAIPTAPTTEKPQPPPVRNEAPTPQNKEEAGGNDNVDVSGPDEIQGPGKANKAEKSCHKCGNSNSPLHPSHLRPRAFVCAVCQGREASGRKTPTIPSPRSSQSPKTVQPESNSAHSNGCATPLSAHSNESQSQRGPTQDSAPSARMTRSQSTRAQKEKKGRQSARADTQAEKENVDPGQKTNKQAVPKGEKTAKPKPAIRSRIQNEPDQDESKDVGCAQHTTHTENGPQPAPKTFGGKKPSRLRLQHKPNPAPRPASEKQPPPKKTATAAPAPTHTSPTPPPATSPVSEPTPPPPSPSPARPTRVPTPPPPTPPSPAHDAQEDEQPQASPSPSPPPPRVPVQKHAPVVPAPIRPLKRLGSLFGKPNTTLWNAPSSKSGNTKPKAVDDIASLPSWAKGAGKQGAGARMAGGLAKDRQASNVGQAKGLGRSGGAKATHDEFAYVGTPDWCRKQQQGAQEKRSTMTYASTKRTTYGKKLQAPTYGRANVPPTMNRAPRAATRDSPEEGATQMSESTNESRASTQCSPTTHRTHTSKLASKPKSQKDTSSSQGKSNGRRAAYYPTLTKSPDIASKKLAKTFGRKTTTENDGRAAWRNTVAAQTVMQEPDRVEAESMPDAEEPLPEEETVLEDQVNAQSVQSEEAEPEDEAMEEEEGIPETQPFPNPAPNPATKSAPSKRSVEEMGSGATATAHVAADGTDSLVTTLERRWKRRRDELQQVAKDAMDSIDTVSQDPIGRNSNQELRGQKRIFETALEELEESMKRQRTLLGSMKVAKATQGKVRDVTEDNGTQLLSVARLRGELDQARAAVAAAMQQLEAHSMRLAEVEHRKDVALAEGVLDLLRVRFS